MSIVRRSKAELRKDRGRVNLEKLRATTEEDIQRHIEEDGGATADFGPGGYFVVSPDYVRGIREKLDMSREAFAESFGLSRRTIEEWELGRQAPTGPARVLLRVIEREPEAVKRALSAP